MKLNVKSRTDFCKDATFNKIHKTTLVNSPDCTNQELSVDIQYSLLAGFIIICLLIIKMCKNKK